jgi:two-component system, chemotaxis family, chemotaxis protein CheY
VRKLLIVDDNAEMRNLIRTLVSDLFVCIHECTDGAEALTAYAEHRPDWVLMDIKMAAVDGFVATRQIKAVFPGANILIVTDYDDLRLRESARLVGARHYVTKENLLEVRRILSMSSQSNQI